MLPVNTSLSAAIRLSDRLLLRFQLVVDVTEGGDFQTEAAFGHLVMDSARFRDREPGRDRNSSYQRILIAWLPVIVLFSD